MPAVAVERGTLPEQRAVFAPLSRLQERVAGHGLRSPTLIVIGEVVSLASGWAQARVLPPRPSPTPTHAHARSRTPIWHGMLRFHIDTIC